jgi:hypothetical protein
MNSTGESLEPSSRTFDGTEISVNAGLPKIRIENLKGSDDGDGEVNEFEDAVEVDISADFEDTDDELSEVNLRTFPLVSNAGAALENPHLEDFTSIVCIKEFKDEFKMLLSTSMSCD